MKKVIHAADLHLSSKEKSYSFRVLEEILLFSQKEQVSFLLFSGDLFDSYKDAYELRGEFRKIIAPFTKSREILFLPGNHEELKKGKNSLASLDLGNITRLDEFPFSFLERENLEFLGVPWAEQDSNPAAWKIPPKKKKNFRIALAHGTIPGIIYTGPVENRADHIIPLRIFKKLKIDYAAMGHIHSTKSLKYKETLIHYPGSARVWRKGESGRHGVTLLQVTDKISHQFVPLKSAGTYREFFIPLDFNGIPDAFAVNKIGFNRNDWVNLLFTGIVEDEKEAARQEERLLDFFKGKARKIEVNRDNVAVLSGIASEPIAGEFIKLWKEKEPDRTSPQKIEIWLKARELALEAIKNIIEARE